MRFTMFQIQRKNSSFFLFSLDINLFVIDLIYDNRFGGICEVFLRFAFSSEDGDLNAILRSHATTIGQDKLEATRLLLDKI